MKRTLIAVTAVIVLAVAGFLLFKPSQPDCVDPAAYQAGDFSVTAVEMRSPAGEVRRFKAPEQADEGMSLVMAGWAVTGFCR